MLVFGSGNIYGISAAANSTPMKLGRMQDVAFDFSFNLKQLHGSGQIAADIRRGSGKITGKAKFANLSGKMLNDLFFNQTATTGLLMSAVGEAGTIPATPFQVTVANGANFDTDLGVVWADTGLPLTKVASAPTTGQYSVSAAGVYTFASADTGKSVLIDYLYTATTGGTKIALSNQAMGVTPTFMGVFTANVGGKIATLKLNSCTSGKLALATKQEDYAIPEFDFEAMADAANNVGVLSVAD